MRSLGVNAIREVFDRGTGARGQGLVLPRILRRPVRSLSRVEWPRHFGAKCLVTFLLATAVTGMVLGDHTRTVISAATAASGLAIDQIRITGQSETSEVDVLERLAIGGYPSLFTFDLDAARARVEELPWVAQATLKKLYPDTIEIAVFERVPYALWQHDGTVSLIDPQGAVITDHIDVRYAKLPLVVGPGANSRVDDFLTLMLPYPELAAQVRAGVLISERRWNLVLTDGVEIMLPEREPAAALARVADIDAESGLLSRDIAAVDLRIPDRFVVRLTETAHLARVKMLKEREKEARKRGADT